MVWEILFTLPGGDVHQSRRKPLEKDDHWTRRRIKPTKGQFWLDTDGHFADIFSDTFSRVITDFRNFKLKMIAVIDIYEKCLVMLNDS